MSEQKTQLNNWARKITAELNSKEEYKDLRNLYKEHFDFIKNIIKKHGARVAVEDVADLAKNARIVINDEYFIMEINTAIAKDLLKKENIL